MIEDPGALSQRADPPSQGGGRGFDVEEIDEIEEEAVMEEEVGLVERGEEEIESLSCQIESNTTLVKTRIISTFFNVYPSMAHVLNAFPLNHCCVSPEKRRGRWYDAFSGM